MRENYERGFTSRKGDVRGGDLRWRRYPEIKPSLVTSLYYLSDATPAGDIIAEVNWLRCGIQGERKQFLCKRTRFFEIESTLLVPG